MQQFGKILWEMLTSGSPGATSSMHGLQARPGNGATANQSLRNCLIPILGALLLVTSPSLTFAQQGSNAALNGTVRDSSGLNVGDAHIVATNHATGVNYSATATSTGTYIIPSLPPGIYDIAATHDGFKKAVVKDVTFYVAQLLTVDMKLDVGSTSTTVTVTDNAPLLESSTSQISHIIDSRSLTNWPAQMSGGERDFQASLYNNLPGTAGSTYYGSINGSRQQTSEIYLDGVSLGNFDSNETGPSIDAISEVNMQVGAMNAQWNGGGTAVTSYAIKSGTNDLHGSLFAMLSNEALNANSYAANQSGTPRAQNRQSIYSGTIGGPIYIPHLYNGRNRSFFFFNYERDNVSDLGLGGATTTMPTQAMLHGDFSAFLNPALTQNTQSGQKAATDILGRPVAYGQIFNPATERLLKAGQVDPTTGLTAQTAGFVREPFVNNQISPSQFDPVAANFLKFQFPTNYLNNLVINNIPRLLNSQPTLLQHYTTIKLDQVLTASQKISFFFTNITRTRSNENGSIGGWSLPGTNVLDTFEFQDNPGQIYRVNHYWTVSPHISNHFGGGYFLFRNNYANSYPSALAQLGIPNIGGSVGFPTISFSGAAALGGGNVRLGNAVNGTGFSAMNFMAIDQVYISHGAHQFQLGFEGRLYRNDLQNIIAPPAYSFSNAETDAGVSSANFAGNAVASFLLGRVDSSSQTIYNGFLDYQRRESGVYIQDDWKVTPHLTLNLGLRWEVIGALTETRGQWSGVNLNLPNSAAGGLPGAMEFASQLGKKGFENPDWGMILPRFGIAYNPIPKLVFKAGFGVNTQAPEKYTYFTGLNAPPTQGYTASIAVNGTTRPQPFSGMAVAQLSDPYPSYTGPLPNYDPTQQLHQSIMVNNPRGARDLYVANYNAGLQMDLGHNTIADLNYVGNTNRRIPINALAQMNQLPLSALTTYGDTLQDNISQHPEIPLPYKGFTGTVQQALAPFPQYAGGGVTLYSSHLGWSRYDAMQATITRRSEKGLSILAAYTWAKLLANTNGGVQDVYNLKAEKAVSSLAVPQQFKVSVIYDLPFGRGKLVDFHGPLNWVVGGWVLTGNAIYQSGSTLAVTDSFVHNGIFATTRPNYTGERVELKQKGFVDTVHNTGPLYLNPAAFTHVPNTPVRHIGLTTGNVPSVLPNVFGPGSAEEKIGLAKGFNLGERGNLTFRANAFNALNRANPGNPVLDINNANFGRILSMGGPRSIQLEGLITF